MKERCLLRKFRYMLLCKLKSDHILQCKAVCFSPCAMMLEYVYFSFKPFSSDFRVSNLSDLLIHLDSFNCDDFLELIRSAAFEGLVEGLLYLHKNGIAHRDLKPASVLVSNQHYDIVTNKDELNVHYQSCPVICKLADFGESRSLLVQTQTVFSTKTDKLDRGTVVYMAPEILLPEKQPSKASMGDLMLCDTWALGMTIFTMINPCLKCPYLKCPYLSEIKESGEASIISQGGMKNFITDLLQVEKRPTPDLKYEVQRATVWADLEAAYR